jgi:hypothetical protein
MVFGIGKVGGPVVDQLALRYPGHRYVVVSRSAERAEKRANLTRYLCSQWGRYPDLRWGTTDLLDVERTATLIDEHRPDVVFNATTPFPWWLLDNLPPPYNVLTYTAGLGMWCAVDCVLPLRLGHALEQARARPVYVNGCYPDVVNAFLRETSHRPVVGIGNFSNVVPGLTLTFADELGQRPQDVRIQLVCNHYTGLNAPTVGGTAGAPYHLTVSHPAGRVVFDAPDDTPFALLKSRYPRVRGLDGQGVTVTSAATVLATFLNGERRRHHTPGPLGLVGGYPVEIAEDGTVALDLPPGVDRERAVQINVEGQRFDGIQDVEPGRVTITDAASDVLYKITGVELPPVTTANVADVAREVVDRLNQRYELRLRL